MLPRIDHIQITVKNFEESEKYYDTFLPILGFDLSKKSKGKVDKHDFEVIEYVHENIVLGINSPREQFKDDEVHRRKPGSVHHIAFRAKDVEEVKLVAEQLKSANINIVDGPKYFPQHGEKYFAVFFKDNNGIKFEVMFEEK